MTAVPVLCAVCGRRMRGHPTVTGRYAVGKHRFQGRKCVGFFFYAKVIERQEAAA